MQCLSSVTHLFHVAQRLPDPPMLSHDTELPSFLRPNYISWSSSVSGHWVFSRILAILNNAATNMGADSSSREISCPLDSYPEVDHMEVLNP